MQLEVQLKHELLHQLIRDLLEQRLHGFLSLLELFYWLSSLSSELGFLTHTAPIGKERATQTMLLNLWSNASRQEFRRGRCKFFIRFYLNAAQSRQAASHGGRIQSSSRVKQLLTRVVFFC